VCGRYAHGAIELLGDDIKSSKVTQKLHAMARIVAKDLVGTMQSLGMAGSIAQACPGGFFGSKWLI
jgi:hypothetical protein